ncbi:MAG: sigma-70 family RNA polymerase sigma factor [Candidatus Omnitrophica bacterium]|nr:sigma-70 family RNA polymerase sigma factor [Candidatus Omnitrophota bacterium]
MNEPPVSYFSGSADAREAALIAQAQGGDLAAFDQLVLQHQQAVFAVAMRMLGDRDEAQDVAQDVFVRAYRAFGAFRREAKLSTWLISITMNLCRNRRRWWARRKRVIVASLDDPIETEEGTLAQEIADPAPSPAHAAQQSEQRRQLMASLQLLNEADRTVIVLRDIQGYAYEEIAQILGCRLGTVKSRINRARLQLRALLDGTLS